MEPLSNIIGICKMHSKKRLKEFQKTFDSSQLSIGDYVKTSILVDKGVHEHMWVKITHLKKNNIIGILDNVPLYDDSKIKFGDIIKVKYVNISDYLPPKNI